MRILLHAGTGGEGREQGRKDGDHDVADATEGFLCTFFHWTHPQEVVSKVPDTASFCLNTSSSIVMVHF